MPPTNKFPTTLLQQARLEQNWTQEEMLEKIEDKITELKETRNETKTFRNWLETRKLLDIRTIKRWERGGIPNPYYRRVLCLVFNKESEQLGFSSPKMPPVEVPDFSLKKGEAVIVLDRNEQKESEQLGFSSPKTPPVEVPDFSLKKGEAEIVLDRNEPLKKENGIRLSAFYVLLIFYWLLFGYMISDIFPKKILRVSGSTHLYMLLRGDYRKTERLKIFVVFFSLLLDWIWVGILVSRIPHPNIFTVQHIFLYGPLLVGLFVALSVIYVILYYIMKWPYVNVINLRKTIEIIVVTTLLTFISPTFGTSFLYFPLFTSVISICLFIYNLISLGSAQQVEGSEVLNEKLERRLQDRLEDERKSEEYFKINERQ